MDMPKRFRRVFVRGHCLACGKPVFRRARTKVKWCSDACRKAAYRARPGNSQADLPAVRFAACKPLKSKAENSRFSKSSLPIDLIGGSFRGHLDPDMRRRVLAAELGIGHSDWRSVISLDGVRCFVLNGGAP